MPFALIRGTRCSVQFTCQVKEDSTALTDGQAEDRSRDAHCSKHVHISPRKRIPPPRTDHLAFFPREQDEMNRYVMTVVFTVCQGSCLHGMSWQLSSRYVMAVIFAMCHDSYLHGVSWQLYSRYVMTVVFTLSADSCLHGVSWQLSSQCVMTVVFMECHGSCLYDVPWHLSSRWVMSAVFTACYGSCLHGAS